MWKRGVTHRGEFERRALALERANLGWWPFAYTLLEDISLNYTNADETLLERLYQSMAGGEDVLKITRRNRFTHLDERLAYDIGVRFPMVSEVVIHDMAASNGITSLELFRTLSRRRRVVVHATDYYDAVWLVTPTGSSWTVVFDVDRSPLQIVGRGFVISARRPALLRHPLNRFLKRWLMKFIVPRAEEHLAAAIESDELNGSPIAPEVRRIRLFHPESIKEVGSQFHLSRHDVFKNNPYPCHVVRIMNALTPNHFEVGKIQNGIKASLFQLAKGGVVILGRSPMENDACTRVTAFEWTGRRLVPAWHLHGGYEWPEIISSIDWVGYCPASSEVSLSR